MIVKPRQKPLKLMKLEALQRRISIDHPQQPLIQESIAKTRAGYAGETALDYPLSFLEHEKVYIFHDLRLFDRQHYVQIDSLLVTPAFLLILEVKNISGELYFDQVFHQLIRSKDGKEEAFPDPIIQIRRQEMQLKKWLRINNWDLDIPVLSLVVISHPSTIIRSSSDHLREHVVHRDYLPIKISEFHNQYAFPKISDPQLEQLISTLKAQHLPLDRSILETYHIDERHLIKGVLCPHCLPQSCHRLYGKWACPQCGQISKNGHVAALLDYRLLIGATISNKEAREFLLISSPSLSSRLLRGLNTSHSGGKKDRTYHLHFPETELPANLE
ncbi:nuclease-related domain-containing protein [Thalassobacillus sp. CUG 92003]|uniref:nuclease-related domain-containing protein n=1 Tax=Thalassobacillus sp. CUG 92003 TaxID=2736641 RepID=UPI0015E7A092|nr:nuclease-related domain-containing protein [Thalassobacillus sp. CUG 92003]